MIGAVARKTQAAHALRAAAIQMFGWDGAWREGIGRFSA
jgi:hypothetical protein